jgi:recombination protein RecT
MTATETAIIRYEPGAPLQHVNRLFDIRQDAPEYKHIMATLNRAWPGDVDPQRRHHKSTQLIEQAALAIAGSERPDSILTCCRSSVYDSMIACASLDLSIQKALGEAYFVPFKGICTLMIGYRGFIKLLVNTGFVSHIESVLVYEGEPFTFRRDETGPHWTHEPDIRMQGQADKVVACYAVGYTRGGPSIFEAMNADELGKVRAASAGVKSGRPSPAYQYWATEMMRKAPIRRLQKFIPKTADNLGYELLAKAAEHDNQAFDLRGYEQSQLEFGNRKRLVKAEAWAASASKPAAPVTPKPQEGPQTPPSETIPAPKAPLPVSSPDAEPPADWNPGDQ